MDHTLHGKWSNPGVPHKGWTCVDCEDLEEPSLICEMCEMAEVRYSHEMTHPDYAEALHVGCVCAEHMSEDYVGPRLRERGLKIMARRRKAWAAKKWTRSVRGNLYLNTEGFNLTVFRRAAGFGVRVVNRANGREQVGIRTYESEAEARDATLRGLVWAKQNLQM